MGVKFRVLDTSPNSIRNLAAIPREVKKKLVRKTVFSLLSSNTAAKRSPWMLMMLKRQNNSDYNITRVYINIFNYFNVD